MLTTVLTTTTSYKPPCHPTWGSASGQLSHVVLQGARILHASGRGMTGLWQAVLVGQALAVTSNPLRQEEKVLPLSSQVSSSGLYIYYIAFPPASLNPARLVEDNCFCHQADKNKQVNAKCIR